MSLPNLSYYLSSLKKQNIIKKIGYGVWEVTPSGEVKISSHKGSLQVKDIRGHAFIWKIKPNKKFNYLSILNSKNIKYELKGISKTPRIILNNKKTWLGSNYITIFEPKINSYFATNTIESKKEAIYSLLEDITGLKNLFGKFRYIFTCRRQHYGFINNPEARHFIDKGKKILIKNEKGYWFSIDFSQNKFKEAETIHEKDADIDGLGYKNYMNSHEKTNFKVTPEFILNGFSQMMTINNELKKNIKSHLSLIKEYRKENIRWRKGQLKNIEKNKFQKTLGDFNANN